ncbi:MAG: sulfatase-like hydrolase/transferase, partial [Acidobacteria bacterium]|nr:sulfatase-like hydrolase/transferase [Acidobacteriota bacterium]
GAIGPGSAGGLRGKKGDLYEGGVRVPGLIEWPARIPKPFASNVPCSTLDIYPTLVDVLGIKEPQAVRPLDGISLRTLIENRMEERPKPLPFWKYDPALETGNEPFLDAESLKGEWRQFVNLKHPTPRTEGFSGHATLVDNRYKLHKFTGDKFALYDLVADPAEKKDLSSEKPDLVERMKKSLEEWQASVERSLSGADYER